MLESERRQVAAAAQRLAADGLVFGTAGNLSVRAGERVAVTPTGAVLGRLEADEITVVDLDGRLVEGDLAPTSEIDLHLGIYRRYGAGAIIHAHSPIATAVACVLDELPLVHYQMLALGGPVRVVPYATFGTAALAELTVDALEERTAVLMANHGMVAVGPDLDGAMENTRLLEWAAELYWRAATFAQVGGVRVITEAQVQEFVEAVTTRGYGTIQGTAG